MSAAQEYVAGVKNLPSVPSVSFKVNELLNDPMSCAKDFDAVISKDPALTAKLLKLVNSAFYGLAYKVNSISRAVSVVGFKHVRDLVNSIAVIEDFKDFDPKALNMRQFWQHSLACGVAGRVLAIYQRQPHSEVFFTAGLLHDIGKLIMLTHTPSEYKRVLELNRDSAMLGYDGETQIFGFTHGEIGAELCRLWNHPEPLRTAVAFHHNTQAAKESQDLVATTHTANIIVHTCQIGNSGDQFVPPLVPSAWKRIGLNVNILESAVNKIHEHVEEIVSALLG